MAKTLSLQVEQAEYKADNGKIYVYDVLYLEINTIVGKRNVRLVASNQNDKYALKEYLKSLNDEKGGGK